MASSPSSSPLTSTASSSSSSSSPTRITKHRSSTSLKIRTKTETQSLALPIPRYSDSVASRTRSRVRRDSNWTTNASTTTDTSSSNSSADGSRDSEADDNSTAATTKFKKVIAISHVLNVNAVDTVSYLEPEPESSPSAGPVKVDVNIHHVHNQTDAARAQDEATNWTKRAQRVWEFFEVKHDQERYERALLAVLGGLELPIY